MGWAFGPWRLDRLAPGERHVTDAPVRVFGRGFEQHPVPVVLVTPPGVPPRLFDAPASRSLPRTLRDDGFDVFVLALPSRRRHCPERALSEALAHVRQCSGASEVSLLGYSGSAQLVMNSGTSRGVKNVVALAWFDRAQTWSAGLALQLAALFGRLSDDSLLGDWRPSALGLLDRLACLGVPESSAEQPPELAALRASTLVVAGRGDPLAPPRLGLHLPGAATGRDVTLMPAAGGHVGVLLGPISTATIYDRISQWLAPRSFCAED